ncbi:MAG: M20/M25/M40 family metallo-hydrolase [Gemmatimonadetes bacterium]|nr:M20/M25/M40 family metallo-hydrolase [Gemmatimonadota bacterium]
MTRSITLSLLIAFGPALSTGALALGAFPLAAQEQIDQDMVARIRAEGFDNSHVLEVFNHLTNVIGPRLTNSPGYYEAVEWMRDKMIEWEFEDVHLESWEFGRGWSLEKFSVEMLEPRYLPMIGFPRGWSASTQGRLVSEPIMLGGKSAEELRSLEDRLGGAIVLTRPIETNFIREDRPQPRFEDRFTPSRSLTRSPSTPPSDAQQADRSRRQEAARALGDVLVSGGVGVTLEPTRGEHGTLFVTGRDQGDGAVPSVVLAAEHYNLVARLLEQQIPVTLAVEVAGRYYEDNTDAYNIIAEIQGVDPEIGDEVVMVGAHLDSWHTGTGATDNADGSSIVMEALRILKALDVQPRRTIRVALWGGEEQGLLGSREYVRRHFEGAENVVAHEKFSVYYNLDNGFAPIYGFFMEGNEAAREIMEDYLEPFNDLGANISTMAGVGSTDHLSFIGAGLPGFQSIHDFTGYDVRTHHTNMDTFERVQEEDLKQAAVVMASILYHSAMRDGRMPRALVAAQR